MRRAAAGVLLIVLVGLAWTAPASAGYKAKIAGGTLTLTGSKKNDKVSLRLKKGAPGKLQIDVGANGSIEFTFNRSAFAAIVVNAGRGNDTVTISDKNGAFTTLENTSIFGGPGKDKLTGGAGAESLVGGTGNDVANGRSGDDGFFWTNGEGSDKLDGGSGNDSVSLTGGVGNDDFIATANGARARIELFPVVFNVGGIETVKHTPLVGFDQMAVHNLSGTGVTTVELDLGLAGVGDGQGDEVVVFGTDLGDVMTASASIPDINISASNGAAGVVLHHSEVGDALTFLGQDGDDTISIGSLATLASVSASGDEGQDILNGGNGPDSLNGGPGPDTVDGNFGADSISLGAGNDVAVWTPGDGSDFVDGEDGDDTLVFSGSAGAEIYTISASFGGVDLTRNIGNILMSLTSTEEIDLNALGGADTITVNDLSTTLMRRIQLDLGVAGVGDNQPDVINVNGSAGVDVMSISGATGTVTSILAALTFTILHAETLNDTLTVNGLAGADLISASGLASSSLFHLTLNGGTENDILVGSSGADTLNGDANTDYCDGGPGADTFGTCETMVNFP
jgi:Ca2+-binding RTX toxin-like protein